VTMSQVQYDGQKRDDYYSFFNKLYTFEQEFDVSPVFLLDKFSFSPGHSHLIERRMPMFGIVWGPCQDLGFCSLMVSKNPFSYHFFFYVTWDFSP